MVIKNRLHCQAGPGSNTYSTAFQLCDLNLFRAQCLHLPDWAFTTYRRGKAAKNGRELGRGGEGGGTAHRIGCTVSIQ